MANSARKAWVIVKRLALGITLICAASAFLLLSDWKRRKKGEEAMPRVAVLKYSTRPLLDAAVDGMIDGLAQHGYVADETIALRIYDAQNDMPTAANIAKEITDGRYDLVMSVSTPCLQAVAMANKDGRCKHVFCAVTDPFGAGVGINRDNPLDHPAHLVGVGTFQPVESLFRLVKKEVFPGLKSVGVVWNPAEACSEACTIKARKICNELGIELLEASVDKSSDVPDAANSLVSRGVEAIWIGGDNTVELAIDSLVAAGRKGRIPVITHGPDNLENGILMALGANYREVGLIAGELAAKVLDGDDMTKMPVEDLVPEKLAINVLALRDLKDPWRISPEMLERADIVCDEKGLHKTEEPEAAPKPLSRKWKVFLVGYVDIPVVEDGVRGVLDGLAEAGLKKGTDFSVDVKNAQGDIATANSIMDLAKTEEADMVIPLCTPTLQAALRRFKKTPIVFSVVASGVQAGAGRTNEDHKPNVTGITTVSDFDGMIDIIRQCMPSARRIGTLLTPAEVNSVFYKDLFQEAAEKQGLELVVVPADTPAEVGDAAASLCAKDIDVFCQISDNLCSSCFPSIVSRTDRAKVPLFTFTSDSPRHGAVLALSRDYYDAGREAGLLAARVMRGADPADIPFTNVKRTQLIINLPKARKYGINVPEALLKRADEVIK